MTISPPVREWTMLSMPSRSAVPGATMSRARRSRGSCRASNSCSSSPGSEDAITADGSRKQRKLALRGNPCGEVGIALVKGGTNRSGGRVLSPNLTADRGISPRNQIRRHPPEKPLRDPLQILRRPPDSAAFSELTGARPLIGSSRWWWAQHFPKPEFLGLRHSAVRVGYVADFSCQADFSEAGQGLAVGFQGWPEWAEAMAIAIARSAPGSSMRTPPATFTNTSAVPSETPA